MIITMILNFLVWCSAFRNMNPIVIKMAAMSIWIIMVS